MLSTLHETPSNQTVVPDEQPTAEEAYVGLYDAFSHVDPEAALDLLEHITTDDILWRLSGENDALQILRDELTDSEVADLKDSIVNDAITLAVHRLPAETITGIGLSPQYFDDAGISQPPTIRDVLLIAKSWDNSDRNETIGDLLAVMLEIIPGDITETPKRALQIALEENILFTEANNRIGKEIDDFLDADWSNAHERVQQRRVRGEI